MSAPENLVEEFWNYGTCLCGFPAFWKTGERQLCHHRFCYLFDHPNDIRHGI